ncbi:unnamed protein product [Nezara viridula]|uniref:Sulfhydryl oxidase n=1 Tax=Nezara viridula TaxID=85310 RepID=A0A9P0E5M8_NEZVI|nr:unnamed protein product [Nezara viridula]
MATVYFDDDCPLDKKKLGLCSWMFLHTMAAYYSDTPSSQEQKDMFLFIHLFAKFYPCKECSRHFQNTLENYPPDVTSRKKLSQWLCEVHNVVNKRLKQLLFDCKVVDQRWRTGWEDGSCKK